LIIAKIISTFGLIEVGETILDPFGTDPEDFALLHFVEVTICHSHETIEIEPCGVRVKERETYYDPKELHAANMLIRRMIKRHRWKKVMEAAKAAEDLNNQARQAAAQKRSCRREGCAISAASHERHVALPRQAVMHTKVGQLVSTANFVPIGRGINSIKLAEARNAPARSDVLPPAALALCAKQKKRRPRPNSRSLAEYPREHPGRQFGTAIGTDSPAVCSAPLPLDGSSPSTAAGDASNGESPVEAQDATHTDGLSV